VRARHPGDPFRSELDWATLGAVREMLQTAHGSLTVGLDAQPGQTLLIRGGTSSIGMATAILAKDRGLTVRSTTRRPDRAAALNAIGVDHVLVDDGDVAAQARAIVPDGVDAALELVGTNTLPDTLRATAVHGVVCFTGMLSNRWTVAAFYPIDYIPSGVRRPASGSRRTAATPPTSQRACSNPAWTRSRHAASPSRSTAPTRSTRSAQAHADMEHGRATGKLVVLS
jgi:NADPH:quinone reductase